MIDKSQLVEIKIGPANFKHFKELGYDVHKGDIIKVPLEHLMNGSSASIEAVCDCCHESYYITYKSALERNQFNKKNYCKKCIAKMNVREKYGVDCAFQLDWVKEKSKNTKIERYGEDYLNHENEKRQQTMKERYGVEHATQLKEFDDKRIKTMYDRYGGFIFAQSPEARAKREQTCLELYGYKSPLESPEIIEKTRQTLSNNSNVRTSSQQLTIYNMLKEYYTDCDVEINYSFRGFSFDIAIFIPNIETKIDIEYDGNHWHQDQQKDRRRDEVSKSYGWKILRIKSGHKTPTIEQLTEAINKLIDGYFYTEIKLDDWRDAA